MIVMIETLRMVIGEGTRLISVEGGIGCALTLANTIICYVPMCA